MKKVIFLALFALTINMLMGQNDSIALWTKEIPNNQQSDEKEIQERGKILRISKVQEPSMEVYLPTKSHATGQAVVICPGGGYGILAYDWEGSDIAKMLNSKGIAAFVLKYRLPKSQSVIIDHKAPLMDVQRAVRLVRANSEKWNVDANKVGVIGFSAGGHLASTIGTHYDDNKDIQTDAIDQLSARPDFLILIYPVITMDQAITHGGSRKKLIGEKPSDELIQQYSNELHVTKDTPPTFLIHCTDDKAVPVENSILFYQALKENNVANSEMHIFPNGGHGFSLALKEGQPEIWTDLLLNWLKNLEAL